MVGNSSFADHIFNDSGHMNLSLFGSINQTIQMFNSNNSAGTYNNETIPNEDTLDKEDEVTFILQNLTFRRIIPSIYIFIILLSLPLNALRLVAFTCKIRVKKPAVIYMSHLACVDLLFTLLLPLKIHYQLNANWVFGEAVCRVLTAAYYCNIYCSILLMMCMSVDRLLAIALPVTSLNWRSTRNATYVCVLVWLLAIAGTVPLLSVEQTFHIQDLGVCCFDIFEDDSILVYLSVFLILPCIYFFLPLVVILVSYSTIIYVLCTKRNNLATSSSSSDNRRRAVIMATAVLIEFVVCFGPSNAFLINHCVSLAMGSKGEDTYPAYLLAVSLGSTSVFLDPLLYYYGSSQYRQLITSVFWGRKAKGTNTPSNTNTDTVT